VTTKLDTERRLAEMEEVISQRGWCVAVQLALAERWDVSPRQVRRLNKQLAERIRAELSPTEREAYRSQLLLQLRAARLASLRRGHFGPVVSMFAMEARMAGVLDAPAAVEPDHLEAATQDELLSELARDLTLEEVRALLALKQGS
jgi:hypothetical protein